MSFAIGLFFVSCAGIATLFAFKRWESESRKVVFPEVRAKADMYALRLKRFVFAGGRDLEKLPPYLIALGRLGVRAGAIAFGHLAHWVGERSHDLADLVSHKHRFEKKESQSEFLKKVGEYPMHTRNGSNGIFPKQETLLIDQITSELPKLPSHELDETVVVESNNSTDTGAFIQEANSIQTPRRKRKVSKRKSRTSGEEVQGLAE